MMNLDSNTLLVIFLVLVLIIILWYLNKNNDELTIQKNHFQPVMIDTTEPDKQIDIHQLFNQVTDHDNMADDVVDELVAKFEKDENMGKKVMHSKEDEDEYEPIISPSDPMEDKYGKFDKHLKRKKYHLTPKKNTDLINIDQKHVSESAKKKEFIHKKKPFIKRTPEELEDLFDVDKMLPVEIEDGWFDVVPLQSKKETKGDWLQPKKLIGKNTIGNTMKYASHDIRGDIPVPKMRVAWNNSSKDPDPNICGLCVNA